MMYKFSVAFAEEFIYDSHGKRDPFVSVGEGYTGGGFGIGELRLEGVIVDAQGDSYALVNGEIVREGESLEGFLLKKVEKNRAIFDKDGEVVEVVLSQEEEDLKKII
ncbi:MAG: hypothetical protein HY583_01115 [Candidatus Omnitrophica bacterium]|nr:hypothetical protein [Candidatus Omnitrophota bacterium]